MNMTLNQNLKTILDNFDIKLMKYESIDCSGQQFRSQSSIILKSRLSFARLISLVSEHLSTINKLK